MSLASFINLAERIPLPDSIIRFGIHSLVARTRARHLPPDAAREAVFAESMRDYPIAEHTDAANAQHYEVPAEFFRLVLGPNRKYSCCLFDTPAATLEDAELAALEKTVEHADLHDGMHILELGCGWGSLSLHMAARFPRSRILSVSNSASQRATIERRAEELGLANLEVVTADMNAFDTKERFDRIVSVEMFEHMSNWSELLERCRRWLKPEGRLFLHVFTHEHASYRFDREDPADWIARHFFTGGIMPARSLAHCFPESFSVQQEWRWQGGHYAMTARHWLASFDRNAAEIATVLQPVYGPETALWMRRWRWFFLATEGLFGHADGDVWGVNHYLMAPVTEGP